MGSGARPPLPVPEISQTQADILVQATQTGDEAMIAQLAKTLLGLDEFVGLLVALGNEMDEKWLRPQVGDGAVLRVPWHEGADPEVSALGDTVLSYVHSRYEDDLAAITMAVDQAGPDRAWRVISRFGITVAQLREPG